MSIKPIKPILKWAGGKSQLLPELIKYIPDEMENYHEPFIGGGSVLLLMLQLQKEEKIKINKSIYAYDINKELIDVYKTIQSYPNELFLEIDQIISEFNSLEASPKKETNGDKTTRKNISSIANDENKTTNKEYYYYWIRNKYNAEIINAASGDAANDNIILLSALFIFLNKTCFRGLYRVNKNKFNVPYGNYVNPEIINLEHLLSISELIKDVIFIHANYTDSFMNFLDGDFIYVDPPYVPESITSFVGYAKDGFTIIEHIELFTLCGGHCLDASATSTSEAALTTATSESASAKTVGKKIIMSNSNTELVHKYFKNDDFHIIEIKAKRHINSKSPNMTTIEVFILNKSLM